jgi:hypothetical protein
VNRRAIPALVVLLAGFAGLVVVGWQSAQPPAATFASESAKWMPHVSDAKALTQSWFCPGVPASGEDGVGGEVVVANRGSEALTGRFSLLTPDGAGASQSFTVGPWSRSPINVAALAKAPYVAVVVELDGSGIVEQRAITPQGDSISPCANQTSDTWYLADGFTRGGSVATLVLSNPYDDVAIAQLSFATESGESSPAAFRGFPVPPKSVKVIPLAELGARDEPVIAVQVTTTSGRVVLGRAQQYLGGGRIGYAMTLAAPSLRDQFWFADGERADGITETYSIYNPTDEDVAVDVVFLGLPADANVGEIPPIVVPAHRVVVFDPLATKNPIALPQGRHAVVFSTLSKPSIVVERVMSRPAGKSVATSVVMGAPPRTDGFIAKEWHIGIGPSEPAKQALVVYNLDNVDGTVSISAVGPGGPAPIAALAAIPIGAGQIITIDLDSPDALNAELILTSTNRVFVERSFPRGHGLTGTSGSWALPAAAD